MVHPKVSQSMLLSLALILFIQIIYLPYALILVLCIELIYLWHIQKSKKNVSKAIKFSFTAIALGAIYLHYHTFVGVEAGVASLTTFLFAKALETQKKRDLIIVFNFALFVAASTFLYSQTLYVALGVVLCLVSCFVGLYRIQTAEFLSTRETKNGLKHDVIHVGKFIGLAIPFFILLFIFFPRLPPLWHLPIQQNKGMTGISDSMSPGDIAELSQSNELAFRIIGDITKLPTRSEMYWRALVLDQYDGQKWTSHGFNRGLNELNSYQLSNLNQKVEYQYLAKDPSVEWIMGLEQSVPQQRNYYLRYDGGISAQRPIQTAQPINLVWLGRGTKINHELSQFQIQYYTQYLRQRDIKSQSLAWDLFIKSGEQPERYIQQVLDWFKQNSFQYSLSPGVLSGDRIDAFMFNSQQGFCEHFASSFVMMMRYVGIPARVVTGYQGGQFAPDQKSWEVRQLDAHAWTEVYFGGQWQRIDPTAMIAPERIDQGMQSLIQNNQTLYFENKNWSVTKYPFLTKIRVWSDYASYQWQSKVVGYNADQQQSWMTKFGIHSVASVFVIILAGSLIILGCYALWMLRKKRKHYSQIDWVLHVVNRKLGLHNRRYSYETVRQWLERISSPLSQNDRAVFLEIIILYEHLSYSQSSISKQEFANFKSMIKTCSYLLVKYEKGLSAK